MRLADGALGAFLDLCAIPSVSRDERAVADALIEELEALGLNVREDTAGDDVGGNAGNLIATLPATTTGTPILLCAHMDTVPLTAPLEPLIESGVVRNRGDGIIGADNKAAVAAMLQVVRELATGEVQHAGVEFVITVCEEVGLLGARSLDVNSLSAEVGFVYDHASDIGRFVEEAPTQSWITATFRGVPAHAGIEPEKGRSAIRAAAAAISAMPSGRIDERTTCNIGRVQGGEAINIVPAECVVTCEARSLDADRLAEVTEQLVDAASGAAGMHDVDCDIDIRQAYAGYRVGASDPARQLAEQALRAAGFEPEPVPCGGGSDANILRAAGLPTVNLCNAMRAIHTADEHIAVADIDAMVEITRAIVAGARVG